MKVDINKLAGSSADSSFSSLMGADVSCRTIKELPITEIIDFENQPFKVLFNAEMEDLIDDIKENGILNPCIVRVYKNKYQLLSGHRRKFAAAEVGLKSIPCYIIDVSDTKAERILVTQNTTNRQQLLPSEKAFAYKMLKESYEKEGAHSVRTTSLVADESGDSVRMIQYYLKLTALIPDLLDMVDDGFIGVKNAASLAALSIKDQEILIKYIQVHNIKKLGSECAIIALSKPLSEQVLNDLLFSNKKERLKAEYPYSTYIVNKSNFQALSTEFLKISENDILKNGTVLKREDYAKLSDAQEKILEQFELIQKIILKNKGG